MANFWEMSWTVLLENSSNRQLENLGAWHRPYYWKTHPDHFMISVKKFEWMSFPVKWSDSWPEKWKFQKHFWISFPWFDNKGLINKIKYWLMRKKRLFHVIKTLRLSCCYTTKHVEHVISISLICFIFESNTMELSNF